MAKASSPLQGKTVLITGGATGIGRAIGIDLAEQGARVMIFGRHKKELDDALKDIPDAIAMTADASKPKDVDAVLKRLDDEFGGLDILIDNAAEMANGLADEPDKNWRYVVETNICGYMAFAKAAAERMKKAGKGHIVLVGSISANSRGKDSSVYVATKSAIQGFSASFAKELAEDNIRVSLIEPGTVGSDMQGPPEPQCAKIKKHKMLKAEDIAECVRFMLTRPERVNISSVTVIPRLQHKE